MQKQQQEQIININRLPRLSWLYILAHFATKPIPRILGDGSRVIYGSSSHQRGQYHQAPSGKQPLNLSDNSHGPLIFAASPPPYIVLGSHIFPHSEKKQNLQDDHCPTSTIDIYQFLLRPVPRAAAKIFGRSRRWPQSAGVPMDFFQKFLRVISKL